MQFYSPRTNGVNHCGFHEQNKHNSNKNNNNNNNNNNDNNNNKRRKMAVTCQRLPYIVENGCVPMPVPTRVRRTVINEKDTTETLMTPKHKFNDAEFIKQMARTPGSTEPQKATDKNSCSSDGEAKDPTEEDTKVWKHSFLKRAFMRMKRRSAIKEEARDPKTIFDIVIPITIEQAESLVKREKEMGNDIKLVGKREEHDPEDRIILNVGGTRHETFCSTLKNFENTRLHWIANNRTTASDHYGLNNEFFFDRHPNAFIHILNYYRTGKLHLPPDVCGPLFAEELSFWGIEEKLMEPCCWPRYIEHREAEENLKISNDPEANSFEDDPIEIKDHNQLDRFFLSSMCGIKSWQATKRKIWKLFDADDSSIMSTKAKIVAGVSVFFILVSILSLCLESIDFDSEGSETYREVTWYVDAVTCTWFTFEFSVRLVTCPNLRCFLVSPSTILDLTTLIPYYLKFYDTDITEDAVKGIFAVARLLRLLRFFQLSAGLHIMKQTLLASSSELVFLLSILFIAGAVFATILHFCERKINNRFNNIPQSMWWAIVTMTTVGYGDAVPHTTIGKAIGAVCAVFSVLILALPISIIGNNFQLYYYYAQARRKLPARRTNLLLGAANPLVSSKRSKYAIKSLQAKRSNMKVSIDRNGTSTRTTPFNENLEPPKQLCPNLDSRRSSLMDFEVERLKDLGLFPNDDFEDLQEFNSTGTRTMRHECSAQKFTQSGHCTKRKARRLSKRLSHSYIDVFRTNFDTLRKTEQPFRNRSYTMMPSTESDNRIRTDTMASLQIPNINIQIADE